MASVPNTLALNCTNFMSAIQRNQARISGPLKDRIDIHLVVQRAPSENFTLRQGGETSDPIRSRIKAARAIQQETPNRWKNLDYAPTETEGSQQAGLAFRNSSDITIP